MKSFLRAFCLALLALAAVPSAMAAVSYAARNHYCGHPTARDYEIGFGILDDSVFRVTVTNERTGEVITRIADPDQPVGFECAWVARVGETAPAGQVHMDANTRYTMVFERLGGGGQTVATLTYTYSLCRSPSDGTSPPADVGNFYCPYGTSVGIPDLVLLWTGERMKVIPLAMFLTMDDPYTTPALTVASVLPYDYNLESRTNPSFQVEAVPFFTRQEGPSYCISGHSNWDVPDDNHWEAADDVTTLTLYGDVTFRDLRIEGVDLSVGTPCGDDPPPSGSGGGAEPISRIEMEVVSGSTLTLRDLDVDNEGRGLLFTLGGSTLDLDDVAFSDVASNGNGFLFGQGGTLLLHGAVAFETGAFTVYPEPQLAASTHFTLGTGATVQHYPDLVVPAGAALEVEAGATMKFPLSFVGAGQYAARGIKVDGTLTASGATFRGFDEQSGWGGIRFRPGTTGTLTGSIVEHFGNVFPDPDSRPVPLSGIEVYDATVTLAGVTVREGINAYGIVASGPSAQVTVMEESVVQANDAGGIYVLTGARLHLYESDVLQNGGVGVRVAGTGARAYVFASVISNNGGVGFETASGAYAAFDKPTGGDPRATTTLDQNLGGGLSADLGATLNAGSYKDGLGLCQQNWNNDITGHYYGGNAPFDARAKNGSTLLAECDYWGPVSGPTDTSNLFLDDDTSSLLDVTPLLTSPPALRTGGIPLAVRTAGATVSGAEQGGGVHALVAQALKAEAEGDWTAAFALYEAALLAAADDHTRRLAFSVTTRLLGTFETPAPPPGLLAALEAFAGQTGSPARPWALRALVAARGAEGDVAEARATAAVLVTGYAGSEHARSGLTSEVALALVAGDADGALTALEALAAQWPEAPETEMAWALAAAALGPDALPAPRLQGAETAAADAGAEEPAAFVLAPPRPNPSRGGAVVPFMLATPARVRLAVYDALGREVAVLADGAFPAGRHEAVLDGAEAGLPSGSYLVRATVEAEGEAPRTFTQRLTLLR